MPGASPEVFQLNVVPPKACSMTQVPLGKRTQNSYCGAGQTVEPAIIGTVAPAAAFAVGGASEAVTQPVKVTVLVAKVSRRAVECPAWLAQTWT